MGILNKIHYTMQQGQTVTLLTNKEIDKHTQKRKLLQLNTIKKFNIRRQHLK